MNYLSTCSPEEALEAVLENCGATTIREAKRRSSGEIHSSREEEDSKIYVVATIRELERRPSGDIHSSRDLQ